MKKLLAALLVGLFTLSSVGCGEKDKKDDKDKKEKKEDKKDK